MTNARAEPELSVTTLEGVGGGSCSVVSLSGRAGIGDCAWMPMLLGLEAARGRGRVLVDLSRLTAMDWSVAIMLMWAGRVVTRRGGALALVSPQPAVARLLNAAGVPAAMVSSSAG
jgi:anti-anti-sigma regulatory factor